MVLPAPNICLLLNHSNTGDQRPKPADPTICLDYDQDKQIHIKVEYFTLSIFVAAANAIK